MANLVENAALYAGGVTRVPGRARTGAAPTGGRRSRVLRRGPRHRRSPRPSGARIFERFYRARPPASGAPSNGTGLGLSLVAEHVRLHGGTVWVEEAAGGGARFTVELPVEDETEWA